MIFQWVTLKISTISHTTQQVESFMNKDTAVQDKKKQKIDAIEPSEDVPILVRMDAAFFDEKLFKRAVND